MKLIELFSLAIIIYMSTTVRAQDDYRLPRTVIPSRYTINLAIEDTFNATQVFTGSVDIEIEILEPVQEIILNSVGLRDFDNITLTSAVNDDDDDNNVPVDIALTEDLNVTLQRMILTPTDEAVTELAAGNYTLRFLRYTGTLYDDMQGFYLSSYTNGEGGTEYIATTQFQSTYARRAFPCFDEPNFKASFIVSIERPTDYMALSNTKLASTNAENTIDTFAETPVMSTYLLAFIVSKFQGYGAELDTEGAERDDEGDIRYDVYSRGEALDTAEYSYTIGPDLLQALGALSGIDYYDMNNTVKMHQVAIPDFSAGAMENWGLVTYRETALLWDSQESTRANLQRVATVIAHEFTHMWFGDLVTLDWWDNTWLNEGFARYYQYFITAQVETDWELDKQFVIEQQQVIFASDALLSSVALSSNASTPDEISAKFGSYSYNKGASVIRMMRNFLGGDAFQEGIRSYLNDRSYQNTLPEYLFTALADAQPVENNLPADLDVIMDNWINSAGYPVVNVTRDESGFTFAQERFLLDSSSTDTTTWYVPITYTTSDEGDFENTDVDAWLLPTENLFIASVNNTGWILVNILETGYYRVNYDDELWDELEEALTADDFSNIPDLNRAQIIDDAMNLARANKLSYSRALNISMFLQADVSYYPWYAAFNAFSFLRRRIDSESEAGLNLVAHITTLMEALNETVTFNIDEDLSHVDTLKTALALQWACDLGQATCTEAATQLFEEFVNDGTAIDPNLRSTVYCSAIRQAENRTLWDFLWQRFQSTTLATEQITILTALGCTQDEDIINEYLGYSIDETSNIRKQDANSVFTGVLAGNPGNVDIALEFFSNNTEDVVAYYEGMNALGSILTGIADRLTTTEQIDTFEAFLTANADTLSSASGAAATALENARANLNWVESNTEELAEWLDARYGSAGSITLNLLVFAVAFITAIKNFF